ncbi:MAG: hypothetical protein RR826_07060, partial [Christensenellaceae bacterium]
ALTTAKRRFAALPCKKILYLKTLRPITNEMSGKCERMESLHELNKAELVRDDRQKKEKWVSDEVQAAQTFKCVSIL